MQNIEKTSWIYRETDTAQFGDVIVIAIPANAVEEAIESGGGTPAFSGKAVIDINNPVSVPGIRTTTKAKLLAEPQSGKWIHPYSMEKTDCPLLWR